MLWWINFFKELSDEGILNMGKISHKECLWFCFHEIIQNDLSFVQIHWNTYYIRRSRHETVAGRPDELFFAPENFGKEDQLQPVSTAQLDSVSGEYDIEEHISEYQEYFQFVATQLGKQNPKSWREALALFNELKPLAE